jgi:hypothetical protein
MQPNYFKKFGLDSNPVSTLGTFGDFAELKAAVMVKMELTRKASVAEIDEGLVLSFVQVGRPLVLSMGKIKCLEL